MNLTKFYVARCDYSRRVNIAQIQEVGGQIRSYVTAVLTKNDYNPDARHSSTDSGIQPLMSLHRDEAQDLFDAMWREGMRPTEIAPTNISALEAHLADMRAIAFQKLRMEIPE